MAKRSGLSRAAKAAPAHLRLVEPAADDFQTQLSKLQKLAASINKDLKGNGHVSFASEMTVAPFRHFLTGIPSFDYITNGGLLESNFTEIWGLQRSTKTTLCANITRNLQSLGKVIGLTAIEPFDADYWRTIGVFVPYSEEEMSNRLQPEYHQDARDYNAYYYQQQIIPLTVFHGKSSDHLLDGMYDAACTNLYDVMFLDSIGEIQSSEVVIKRKISSESMFGGDTALIKRMCRFIRHAMNMSYTQYDSDGNLLKDPVEASQGEIPNKLSFVGMNQGRQTFGTMAMAQENQYHSPGGQAWQHQLAQSIFLQRVDFDLSKVNVEGTRDAASKAKSEANAVMIRLKGTKMKGGPEQRECTYRLHIRQYTDEYHLERRTGELDCAIALKFLCLNLGIIQRAGNSYEIEDLKFKKTLDLDMAIFQDQELYQYLYGAMIQAARDSAETGHVPALR